MYPGNQFLVAVNGLLLQVLSSSDVSVLIKFGLEYRTYIYRFFFVFRSIYVLADIVCNIGFINSITSSVHSSVSGPSSAFAVFQDLKFQSNFQFFQSL